MRVTGIAMLCVLIAGCSPIEPPEPAGSHPANPSATSGPRRQLSPVLEVDEGNLPRRPPEMQNGHSMEHDTSGGQMQSRTEPDAANEAASRVYTCSMHPRARQPQPGRCPICTMELIPSPTGQKRGQ